MNGGTKIWTQNSDEYSIWVSGIRNPTVFSIVKRVQAATHFGKYPTRKV